MPHDVESLLTMLRDLIEDSFTLPLGSDKCVLDKDKAMGLLDEIAGNLPEELRKAVSIVEQRNDMIAKAKSEAESIVRTAEERARRMLSEEEILTTARRKAQELENQTKSKTRDLRIATNEYVEDLLKRTEEAVNTALNEVRKSRLEFRNTAKR
ncbi:MAG: ATPase [Oscillospiraceae bacterium]|jgi:vacuolar-type H+-ATPase subunit H|nr:ATPase [Oscillospiraceae bacterium]